jgi:HSP20 family protein
MFGNSFFDDFVTIHRNFDQLFNRVLGGSQHTSADTVSGYSWIPSIESYVLGDKFYLRASLPGVDSKNVEVSVTENVLTVRGERVADQNKDMLTLFNEIPYGKFERKIVLPKDVANDLEKSTAKFVNGVLEISMPVTTRQMSTRRIPIQDTEEKKQIAAVA